MGRSGITWNNAGKHEREDKNEKKVVRAASPRQYVSNEMEIMVEPP